MRGPLWVMSKVTAEDQNFNFPRLSAFSFLSQLYRPSILNHEQLSFFLQISLCVKVSDRTFYFIISNGSVEQTLGSAAHSWFLFLPRRSHAGSADARNHDHLPRKPEKANRRLLLSHVWGKRKGNVSTQPPSCTRTFAPSRFNTRGRSDLIASSWLAVFGVAKGH